MMASMPIVGGEGDSDMSKGRIIYPNNDNLQEQFCSSFVLARGDGNESL
jgi:hypothetical protein